MPGATVFDVLSGRLSLDISKWKSGWDQAAGVASRISKTISGGIANLAKAAAVGFAALTAAVTSSVHAAGEAEAVQAQLRQAIKTTGGQAGVTANQINDMAQKLARLTKFGDDTTVQMANLLLTFRNIKGQDVFKQTIEGAQDMATALGQDAVGSARLLGRALNDPIRGMMGLARVGIRFTEEQRAAIKKLVESGKTLQAQQMILGEIQGRFGGSAKAAAKTFQGAWAQAHDSIGELSESIGMIFLPRLTSIGRSVRSVALTVQEWVEANSVMLGRRLDQGFDLIANAVQRTYNATRLLADWAEVAAEKLEPFYNAVKNLGETLWEHFERLPPGVQDLALVFGGMSLLAGSLGAMAAHIPLIGGLASAVIALLNPFGILKGLLAVIWPILTGIGSWLAGFGAAPVLAIGAAITAVVGSIIYAIKATETGRDLWRQIKEVIGELIDVVTTFGRDVLKELQEAWSGNAENAQSLGSVLLGLVAIIGNTLLATLRILLTLIVTFLKAVLPVVKLEIKGLAALLTGLASVLGFISDILSGNWQNAWKRILELFLAFSEAIDGVIISLGNLLGMDTSEIGKDTEMVRQKIREIEADQTKATEKAKEEQGEFGKSIEDTFGKLQAMWNGSAQASNDIQAGFTGAQRSIIPVGEAVGDVSAALGEMGDEAEEAGEDAEEAGGAIQQSAQAAKEDVAQLAEEQRKLQKEFRNTTDEIRSMQRAGMAGAGGRTRILADIDPAEDAKGQLEQQQRRLAELKQRERDLRNIRKMFGGGEERTPGAARRLEQMIAGGDPVKLGEQFFGKFFQGMKPEAAQEVGGRMIGEMQGQIKKLFEAETFDRHQFDVILGAYRAMLAAIPGFAGEEFAKVEEQIRDHVGRAVEAAPALRGAFVEAIGEIAGDMPRIFEPVQGEMLGIIEQMGHAGFQVSKNLIANQRDLLNDWIKDAAGAGATRAQLLQLGQMRDAVIEAMRIVAAAQGPAKAAAIENAKAIQAAFEAALQNIAAGGRAAFGGIAADAEQAAGRVVQAAQKMARGVEREMEQARRQARADQGLQENAQRVWGPGTAFANQMGAVGGVLGQIAGAGQRFGEYLAGSDPATALDARIAQIQAELGASLSNQRIAKRGAGWVGQQSRAGFGSAYSNVGGNIGAHIESLQAKLADLQRQRELLGSAQPMALGGIVTKPTLSLLGEAGPEAVVPLGGGGIFGGGEHHWNITLTQKYTAAEARDLVDAVEKEVNRRGRDMTGRSALRSPNRRMPSNSRIQ